MLMMMVLLIIDIIAAIWLFMGASRRMGAGEAQPARTTPEQILAERLARAEIDPDEYRTRIAARTKPTTGTDPALRPIGRHRPRAFPVASAQADQGR